MSDFSTRQSKPTTKEYLEESLDNVLDRQNQNPQGLQSEDTFISSVIAVRAAKINERLGTRLNWLYLIIAVATVLLVVVPFFVPSFEGGKLTERIEGLEHIQSEQTKASNTRESQLAALHGKVDELLSRIQALEKQQREQDGGGQPATRPESE